MNRAMGTDAWARMERTLPGALSKVLDNLLYNWCDEGKQEHRGLVLNLSNADRMYVGFKEEWPRFDGRIEATKERGYDVAYVDVRKSLRTIQYLLEAYAFAESHGTGKPHVCKHCGSAAP